MAAIGSIIRLKIKFKKIVASPTGFEPVREDPNGFLVHRLNHSATTTTWSTLEIVVIYNLQNGVGHTSDKSVDTFSAFDQQYGIWH